MIAIQLDGHIPVKDVVRLVFKIVPLLRMPLARKHGHKSLAVFPVDHSNCCNAYLPEFLQPVMMRNFEFALPRHLDLALPDQRPNIRNYFEYNCARVPRLYACSHDCATSWDSFSCNVLAVFGEVLRYQLAVHIRHGKENIRGLDRFARRNRALGESTARQVPQCPLFSMRCRVAIFPIAYHREGI